MLVRLAGLNLLAAIIIYWNTAKLGEAVNERRKAGLPVPAELPAHVSLGRNYLLDKAGDKINAILATAGHHLRRLRVFQCR